MNQLAIIYNQIDTTKVMLKHWADLVDQGLLNKYCISPDNLKALAYDLDQKRLKLEAFDMSFKNNDQDSDNN